MIPPHHPPYLQSRIKSRASSNAQRVFLALSQYLTQKDPRRLRMAKVRLIAIALSIMCSVKVADELMEQPGTDRGSSQGGPSCRSSMLASIENLQAQFRY